MRIMRDSIGISIKLNAYILAHQGKRTKVVARAHNLVVTAGKTLLAQMMAEEVGYNTGLTYQAVGTNNTTPQLTDTQLVAEHVRNTFTKVVRTVNVVQFRTFFTAAEANVYIKEVGLFGHSTATSALNSGVLFNRALLAYDNSGGSPLDLTIVIEITFG